MRCPRAAAQHHSQRDIRLPSNVLLRAHRGPHAQIVDEVQQVIVRAVADDRGKNFSKKAPFDPAQLALLDFCPGPVWSGGGFRAALLITTARTHSLALGLALPSLSTLMRGPGHRFTKVAVPVETGPQRALQTLLSQKRLKTRKGAPHILLERTFKQKCCTVFFV